MKKSAILIVSIFYCAFFMGQDLRFSRNFSTVKKNVPLAIVNNHPDYFFVLRYNKLAHDLVIERRRKSNGEMINITPLKMDSINARSFNYENLDYLFFAGENKAYVVFEKVTTGRRSVYMRTCDTNGKVGSFFELASIERTSALKDFYFQLKKVIGNKNVLVVATRVFHDNSVSRVVYLFNVKNRTLSWEKKLPPENESAGYAHGFETDSLGNLFYFLVHSRLIEYRRQYINHYQRMMPVYHFDSVNLHFVSPDDKIKRDVRLGISDFSLLNGTYLFLGDTITASVHFSKLNDATGKKQTYFLGQGFTADLTHQVFEYTTPLKQEIATRLEFFDGGDTKDGADKQYDPVWQKKIASAAYQLAGRSEEDFSKEMIFWHTDLHSGRVVSQAVVPRKIFYFEGRTRFKNMGISTTVTSGDTMYTFILEHVSNEKIQAADFNYPKFQKQEYAKYANLACYYYCGSGELKKKIILKNIDFDCVPLNYRGNQREIIFFQFRGPVERFVFLKLNRF